MSFDDRVDYRQPHTHAMRLCRERRIEDALQVVGCDTGTGVSNPDFRVSAGSSSRHADFALLCLSFRYRVHRVDNEIENDLLKLNEISPDT